MAVSTGTYANRPSSHSAGDIYLTTDSFWDYLVSNGSKWRHLYSGFECEPPINSEFSWVNQGGASIITANGGVFMRAPVSSTGNLRLRAKTAPATPYTLTAAILPAFPGIEGSISDTKNGFGCGIGFRESGTGKLSMIGFRFGGIGVGALFYGLLDVMQFSSPTATGTSALNAYAETLVSSPITWLKVTNTGTTLTYFFSGDGQNFQQVYTEDVDAYFTTAPDELFFTLSVFCATHDAGVTLIHWSLPNPAVTMRTFGMFGVLPSLKPTGNYFGAFG